MKERDQISIGSQSILWVAGLGVGLVTLAFVLGVQVGKQSAALRRPVQKSIDEEMKELPEPLVDQLKIFEGDGPDKLVPAAKVDAVAPKEEPKAEAKPAVPAPAPAPETWTLQLVATSDAAEAKRIAAKAKGAGFNTTTLKDGKQLKVRLTPASDRAAIDKATEQLKKAGLKPFAVKVE